jgi:exosortase
VPTVSNRTVLNMQKLKRPSASTLAWTLNQHRLAVAVKFGVITAAVVALYFQDLSIIFAGALTDESTFHILAIPFLFAYLLFRRRKMIGASIEETPPSNNPFLKHFDTIAGILLSATAIVAYWYGSYSFTPLEFHMVTLPFLAAGLILIFFGSKPLKQLIFPVAFLIFLTPPPAEILYAFGSALSNLSASVSNGIINLFGISSTLTSSYGSPVITLNRPDQTAMSFSVDVACSGIYSIIGFVIFALFIAYITRGKLRNKLAVLLMGIPLIIALNILRITIILSIGYYYGDQLALEVFHTVGATVLMFIGTLILLAVTEKIFKKPPAPQSCPDCSQAAPVSKTDFCPKCGKLFRYPKIKLHRIDFAKIAVVVVVIVLLMFIQTPVFALTQGPAETVIQTPSGEKGNTEILPQVPGYTLNYVYRDTAFEELSGEQASLVYAYGLSNSSTPPVWVAVELASSIGPLHRWETCLINYPISEGGTPEVKSLDIRDVQTQENPPIIARYFAFQYRDSSQTQVVLYWYQTARFNINGTSQTFTVKMSLVQYLTSAENLTQSEDQLYTFAVAINQYWQPIQSWTRVAIIMSQNGLLLSETTAALLAAVVVYAIYLQNRARHFSENLYYKLPEQDRLLVKAVINTQEQGNASTENVAAEYQKLTNTPHTLEWVEEKLEQAQTAGLLEKKIASVNDYPALSWQTQFPNRPAFLKWLPF